MKTLSYLLAVSVTWSIALAGVSAEAQNPSACLMSTANPGVCLGGPVNCSGTEAELQTNYGNAVAMLCLAGSAQTIQCQADLSAQSEVYNSQLSEEEANRLEMFKALERSQARIRALKRQVRSARR